MQKLCVILSFIRQAVYLMLPESVFLRLLTVSRKIIIENENRDMASKHHLHSQFPLFMCPCSNNSVIPFLRQGKSLALLTKICILLKEILHIFLLQQSLDFKSYLVFSLSFRILNLLAFFFLALFSFFFFGFFF